MNPDDSILITNAYAFFSSLFVLTLCLGIWLGWKLARGENKYLWRRIERQKLEIQTLDPRRGFNLR